ncbi:MAG: SRPBCC family protein [Solirubrobacteraceae bacterium]
MPEGHAVLLDREGRSVLRFQRVLAQRPERVWRALTDPGELQAWHPTPFRFEPTDGGAVTFIPTPGAPEMPPGRVLAYRPPGLLAYTWGDDRLQFTVEPQEQGSLLTLEHSFEDRLKAARDGAGWHLCLRALQASLDGRPVPGRADDGRVPRDWPQLNGEYQQRFGIAPEQATPPPPR